MRVKSIVFSRVFSLCKLLLIIIRSFKIPIAIIDQRVRVNAVGGGAATEVSAHTAGEAVN